MHRSLSPSPAAPVDKTIYPSSDGRPLAETGIHCKNFVALLDILDRHFADDPWVYVWGNLFVYYERGNKRKHVTPDLFFVRGVPKNPDKPRDYFLCWEEGHTPDFVIELTSKSTRKEDVGKKKELYRDVLKVREYLLFDPLGDYLKPRLQGFRLRDGEYEPLNEIDGRLSSEVLGLHFEAEGVDLHVYDPASGQRLLTTPKLFDEAAVARDRATAERDRATAERDRAAAERDSVSAENEQLLRELAELRRRLDLAGPAS